MKATHTYLRLFLAFLATAGTLCAETYRAGMYGVVADGKTDNAEALQEIIDHCSASGGGTVVIDTGTVVSGQIRLKSNVTLKIAEGAVLKCTQDAADYALPEADLPLHRHWCRYLVYARNQENIAVTGQGTIKGHPGGFPPMEGDAKRPKVGLIRFDACRNVTIEGITLLNASHWTQHIYHCDQVRVSDVTVDNRALNALNDDGLNIDGCQNVRVENCTIYTHDDALTLKNTSDRACRDVTVSDCRLTTRKSAFKFGTESLAGFINVHARNLELAGGRDAIALASVDGAHMKDILIENVTVRDSECPLFIRLGARLRKPRGDSREREVGTVENLTIRNLKATTEKRPFRAIMIAGIEGHRIKNVRLENIDVSFRTLDGDILPPGKKAKEKDRNYPASTMFGLLPSWGLFVRHADRVALKNVTLESTHGRDPERMVYSEDMGELVWE